MRQLIAVLLLCVCAPASAAPPRQAYRLTATLDPVAHRVDGQLQIEFVNHSAREVSELFFHLYPNAFESERTVFMREGGGKIRGKALEQRGRIEVLRLTSEDGTDLLTVSDDELVPDDHTQLRVPLPRPLQPGERLALSARFRTTLPEIVARSGYAGSFHMLGQWFPKLARLEESGEWKSFPYHGLGEFYADFADYELTLRVPRGYVCAAGGVRVESRDEGEVRVERFVSENVHDISAACDPTFERTPARAGAIAIEVYAPRGYGAAAQRQAQLLAAGLRYFSAAYGAYPYPQLTAVIPPRAASGAAGMEYPTLLLSGGPWWALPSGLPDPDHDVIAIHELAHQWFSGMIASDEVSLPMLDEGLAQWSSLEFLRTHYRPRLDPFDLQEATFLFRGLPAPSSLLPVTQYRYQDLARAVYLRPARVLNDLERRYGRPKLMAAMRRYALAQRFRHPGLPEFYAAFDAELGPGFAARELQPALSGERDLASNGPARPKRWHFLPDLWFAIQTLLRVIGP
ncbi:MAG TPA: M1 family metallopeptidase [Polyangiales bacterium]|nr:M1 family metallopeptidase [Polyangiales bacterium]